MRHIEFLHNEHFEKNYHRVSPPQELRHLIDFFWEIHFDELWKKYPAGFSDALFPNIGYTYVLNMGTPFVMQVGDKQFRMKTDGLLPRYNSIECFHEPGNHFFGIKFRISPVIFEKNVDFSEYRGQVYPLSYLMDPALIRSVKTAASFQERIDSISECFSKQIKNYEGSWHPVHIAGDVLEKAFDKNEFITPIDDIARRYSISSRTLQRYFEKCTGINCKQALQMMRIRKATTQLTEAPESFHYSQYGYYDKSHFYKHLKEFLQGDDPGKKELYQKLLESV